MLQNAVTPFFSSSGWSNLVLDLRLKGEPIPYNYNQNPLFLGITFDESLCFNAHFFSLQDYSFFSIACVSATNLGLVQRVQNRAIRCIYKLKWDECFDKNECFLLSVLSLVLD